jgi:hypothetical protein
MDLGECNHNQNDDTRCNPVRWQEGEIRRQPPAARWGVGEGEELRGTATTQVLLPRNRNQNQGNGETAVSSREQCTRH